MQFQKLVFALAFRLVVLGPLPSLGQVGSYCIVSDPTGTALNVRANPNGKTLRNIKNETPVFIREAKVDSRNRAWTLVTLVDDGGPRTKSAGWVIRSHLFCGTTQNYVASDPVSSALQTRSEKAWSRFFTEFKNAVVSRNKDRLLTMGFEEPDFIELGGNDNRGWKELDRVLRLGYIQIMFPAEARHYIDIPNNRCGRDGTLSFVVAKGRWQVERFGMVGCGH